MAKKPTYEELQQTVKELQKEALERQRADQALQQKTRELAERVKELNCLYEIGHLREEPGLSLEEMLRRSVDLISAAWQFPEITSVRLILDGQEYKTDGFRKTPWRKASEITVHGKTSGIVEVFYLEERPERDEGPFLQEKRDLLDAIAKRLGKIIEHERAEEALAEERNLLRTVIDNLPDYVYVKDTNSRYLLTNNAHVRFLGATTPDEVVGKTVFELFPQELASKYYADDQEVIRSGVPILTREERSINPKGEMIWNQTTKVPLQDSSGRVTGLVGIARDISKHRRAEEALRQSEEKYRTILKTIEEGYYEVDIRGNFTFFNNSLCRIHGYSKDKLMGMNNREYMDQETAKKVYQTFSEVYATGTPARGFDWAIVRKDGTKRHLESSVSLIRDAEGQAIGFRGIVRDITERKQAEEALRESEERFRVLVEESPLGVSLIEKDGHYKYINPKFTEIFGYTLEDIPTGQVWFRKAYPDQEYRKQVISAWISDIEEAKAGESRSRIYNVRCKDGSEKTTHFRPVVMENEEQFVIFEDITEQRCLEAQLQHAQRMESMGTLAGGIAHNFNNLLMAIQGNASLMLLGTESTHPNHERLKNIEKSVQNGSRLTSQLLGYAREGRYEIKPISLNQVVEETSDTFATTKREITVHRELAGELSEIKADQGQIEQVLLNLYVNAADAMPGGGDLFLETTNATHDDMRGKPYTVKPGNYVLLTVRDTGIGMDKKTMERIFDPFFTTKGLAKGTGLGLASVYGIVKAHGGYIDVDSKKGQARPPRLSPAERDDGGQGTTFSIYLPASQERVEKPVKIAEHIVEGGETILLVDDEEMVLEVGAQLLETLGYTVLEARGGTEAVEVYRENKDKIDMVLLDMIMPEMGGGETYDRMKEINPDIKVLLSSGYSIDGQAAEILERGCNGFIQKPFSMKELSQKIREILEKK